MVILDISEHIIGMSNYEKKISSPTTITICIHTKIHCTNMHNINIHSYTISIRGPIGLFSNKWTNGTKSCGLDRTSVENLLKCVECALCGECGDTYFCD